MRSNDLSSRPPQQEAGTTTKLARGGPGGGATPQMEPQVRATLDRLLGAQGTLRSEMQRLGRAQPLDREALRQLRHAVHGFADQADRLLLALVGQGAPPALVGAAEEIFDAFRDAEGQIETVLRRGRR